ncbi:MAG: EamA family transporter [Pseudomonadales bacterium]
MAIAIVPPLLWGSTYLVTTELLPVDKPLTAAMLRILPVGLLITLLTRQLPERAHWPKLVVISLLSMSIFHWALFVSAYRLPGGLAALLVTSQPLLVAILGYVFFGSNVTLKVAAGIIVGLGGVALVLSAPSELAWDSIGILAAFSAALSMSLGTLLIKRWQLPIPVLAFTGWQLTIGGLALLPAVLFFEMPLGPLEAQHLGGYFYLAILGTLIPYLLWFSALRYLDPVLISTLILLSPLSAMVLGYIVLGQTLTTMQLVGAAAILTGIVVSNVPIRRFSNDRA